MGNIVKFAKPYSFEGTEYTEVDLSGMDKLTIQDMIDIQKPRQRACFSGCTGSNHVLCTGDGDQGQRQAR